jgi:hypothetical protein
MSAAPPATLQGRWLLLARTAWVAVAIATLAIVVFSVSSSIGPCALPRPRSVPKEQ